MKRYQHFGVIIAVMLTITSNGFPQQYYQTFGAVPGGVVANGVSVMPAGDDFISDLLEQTNLDSLNQFVKFLSGVDSVTISGNKYLLQSRNLTHPHNDLAADYIFQTLERYGLQVYNQNFNTNGRNVYAVQTGSTFPDQKFIVCAHYDDMPYQAPAPGADDNASGTAVVLEAARLLSLFPTPYTIIYALWDEEEVGLFGSHHFAQQAAQSGEEILAVLNLDMVAYDGNNDGKFEIHTRPVANSLAMADLIYDLHDQHNIGLVPDIFNPGTNRSDHASFWNYNFTAVLLIEALYGNNFNPFYHTANDKIDHFNPEYFHGLAKLAIATLTHMAYNNVVTGLERDVDVLALAFELAQNYPNPFNTTTTIEFYLPDAAATSLVIYNSIGQVVATLVDAALPVGSYAYRWDAQDLASGVYFYQLRSGAFTETKKMLLTR